MVIEENHAFEQIIGSPAAPYSDALTATVPIRQAPDVMPG
jgi:hypothetical protein